MYDTFTTRMQIKCVGKYEANPIITVRVHSDHLLLVNNVPSTDSLPQVCMISQRRTIKSKIIHFKQVQFRFFLIPLDYNNLVSGLSILCSLLVSLS
mgnify:CR=1 FL=1